MLRRLLPSSSLDLAQVPAPIVVLNSDRTPWLYDTLKRIRRENGFKRREKLLNSVEQCEKFLTQILDNKSAIWSLADAKLDQRTIEIKANVVSIDMVSRNEATFRLTIETADALIQYHKEVHCVLGRANYAQSAGKEQQIKEQHEKFVADINAFRFYSDVRILTNLQVNGAGNFPLEEQLRVNAELMNLLSPPSPPFPASCVNIPLRNWTHQQTDPYLADCYTAVNLRLADTAILPSQSMICYSNTLSLAGNSIPFPSTLIQNLPWTVDYNVTGEPAWTSHCGGYDINTSGLESDVA